MLFFLLTHMAGQQSMSRFVTATAGVPKKPPGEIGLTGEKKSEQRQEGERKDGRCERDFEWRTFSFGERSKNRDRPECADPLFFSLFLSPPPEKQNHTSGGLRLLRLCLRGTRRRRRR